MKNHPPITLQRHLSPFLPNQYFDKSIQYFVTNSSISSNNLILLGFHSSDLMGKFTKLLKKFGTSDMDNSKDISSVNSIDFDDSTKIYAHSSGGQKSQTAPTKIYPLRARNEDINNLSSIFGLFDIDEGNSLHLS